MGVRTLRGYDRNARTHSDAQVAQLAAAISRFGFTNPILADEHGVIIAGHGRMAAAERLGLDRVPCIRVTGLSEHDRAALVLADNQIALNAGWDEKVLAEELRRLQAAHDAGEFDYELTDLGFSEAQLKEYAEILAPEPEKEEVREILVGEEPHVVRAGETWVLGPHRLTIAGASGNDLRAADALILAWERQTRTEAQLSGGGMTFKARAQTMDIEFKRQDTKAQKARVRTD
nr:ParB N-terminal domain-containing protein [Methylobacterium sp.]